MSCYVCLTQDFLLTSLTIPPNWFQICFLLPCMAWPATSHPLSLRTPTPLHCSSCLDNTFPSCRIPSLLYFLPSVIPQPPPLRPPKKHLCSFEAQSGLRCSYQVSETRAPHPQGGRLQRRVCEMNKKKHLAHLNVAFQCFSSLVTFFFWKKKQTTKHDSAWMRRTPSPHHHACWSSVRRGGHQAKSDKYEREPPKWHLNLHAMAQRCHALTKCKALFPCFVSICSVCVCGIFVPR